MRLAQIVHVGAAAAIDPSGCRANQGQEFLRDHALLARERVKRRQDSAHLRFVLPVEVQFQPTMNASEDNLRFQLRLSAVGCETQTVTRDQQFVGSAFSKHIRTQHGVRYDNGVQTVHSNGLDWVQILQWFAVFTSESNVATNISCRTARFESTDHITLRQLLMFDTEQGVSVDASFFEYPHRPPGER